MNKVKKKYVKPGGFTKYEQARKNNIRENNKKLKALCDRLKCPQVDPPAVSKHRANEDDDYIPPHHEHEHYLSSSSDKELDMPPLGRSRSSAGSMHEGGHPTSQHEEVSVMPQEGRTRLSRRSRYDEDHPTSQNEEVVQPIQTTVQPTPSPTDWAE